MDKFLLDYEIKRKGYSIKQFCEMINIPRTSFYKKSKGLSEFTRDEIKRIIDTLNLDNPTDIFFKD